MPSGRCRADAETAPPTTVKDQYAIDGRQNAFAARPLPAQHFIDDAQYAGQDEVDQNKHPVLFAPRTAAKSYIVFNTLRYQSISTPQLTVNHLFLSDRNKNRRE